MIHKTIFVFGFRTYEQNYSRFCIVYDKLEDAVKYKPKSRLVKNGIHVDGNKSAKDSKNREKKMWCYAKKTIGDLDPLFLPFNKIICNYFILCFYISRNSS